MTNSCTAEFHPGGLDDCQHQHSPVSPLQQEGGENIERTDITRACVEVGGGSWVWTRTRKTGTGDDFTGNLKVKFFEKAH